MAKQPNLKPYERVPGVLSVVSIRAEKGKIS
jgi:hypothetical protein